MKKLKKIIKAILFLLLGLVILAILVSTVNNRIGNCRVKGEITGLGTRSAMVSGGTSSQNKRFFKIILIINGRFSFKTKLDEPGSGRILARNMLFPRLSGKPLGMRSKFIEFSISPDQTISINGSMSNYSIDYLVTGNRNSEQGSKFRHENIKILEQETQLYLKFDSSEFNGMPKSEIDSLSKLVNKTREEYNNQRLKYAIQNPTHEVSASFLSSQPKDSIIKYFPLLSENVVATNSGKKLHERFLAYTAIAPGKEAPDFSLLTYRSEKFSLSDLRGKYVVLDFWGTWCGWCVKGFPKMQQYYEKNRDKVEFVGIACRDNKIAWENFLKERELNWIQLFDDDKNSLIMKFSIDSYPTRIILDKEGKIVEIFAGETDAFYTRLDELLQ